MKNPFGYSNISYEYIRRCWSWHWLCYWSILVKLLRAKTVTQRYFVCKRRNIFI